MNQNKVTFDHQNRHINSHGSLLDMVNKVPYGLIGLNHSGDFLFINPYMQTLVGYSPEKLLGKNINLLIPVRDRKIFMTYLNKLKNKSCSRIFDIEHNLYAIHENGHEFPIEIRLSSYACTNENEPSIIAIISDISKHKETANQLSFKSQINESSKHLRDIIVQHVRRSEKTSVELFQAKEQLMQEKEIIQLTLESITDGVISTDIYGNIEYLNPIAERFFGYTSSSAKGSPANKIFKIRDETSQRMINDPIQNVLQKESSMLLNSVLLVNNHGDSIIIKCSIAPIKKSGNNSIGAIMVFHDITETRKLMEQLSYQASHDMLTNLINRREFENRLKKLVEHEIPKNAKCAIIYIDLDQFKLVNDTCGHIAGDELLRQVSHLLQRKVDKGDSLARLGGDEFCILINYSDEDEALKLSEEILADISDLRFIWECYTFKITASIGLMLINKNSGNAAKILSLADAACYKSKFSGRNQIYQHQENTQEAIKRRGEFQWLPRINEGMEDDNFYLESQKIIALNGDNDKSHFEILIRLKGTDNNAILPGAFLPTVERYNLFLSIDQWVINKTFNYLKENPQIINELYVCAINISACSLTNKAFAQTIQEKLEKSMIPPEKICFEITETSAIANLTSARKFMKKLNDCGCKFSLDDFGTGMSSFSYLKNLPVDFLKIDGAFVKNIDSDPVSYAFVKSINEIGHVLGMKTIAEFVENADIQDKLIEIGVDYAQGYAISKPGPLIK